MTDTTEYVYDSLSDAELKTVGPWLKDMLKTGPLSITFTKKDGTERVMVCTLQPELLPPVVVTENTEPKRQKAVNEDVIAVYDLESKGWRSFTIRSVKRIVFDL